MERKSNRLHLSAKLFVAFGTFHRMKNLMSLLGEKLRVLRSNLLAKLFALNGSD